MHLCAPFEVHSTLSPGCLAGVVKRSVDTWMDPGLFHMQYSIGARQTYSDTGGLEPGVPHLQL